MLEPLRCPGCSTRFVLGPGRVRPGIRRAKCFRCDSVFSIEEAVARLLAPVPDQPAFAAAPEPGPSLTLEDLQGVQDELLDAPEAAPAAPAEAPYVAAAGNFSSAKDAIAQLLGSAPIPPPPVVRLGGRSAMDVEATLDALSTTLGGAPEAPVEAPVEPPPPPRKSDMSSTVKLTSEEIKIAMASAVEQTKPAAPMASAPPRPEPPAEYPPAPQPEPSSQTPDLLKIQLEQETCNNVTIEQMTAWIEQGRVLEYHMVARQYSENWIEASKVPALRPVFERVRRIRETQAEEAPKAPEPPPVKRGLFAGLFGRN